MPSVSCCPLSDSQFQPARAKATSSAGGSSGETYVRKLCCSSEQMWEKEQTPRPVKKEEEVFQVPEQTFPYSPGSRPRQSRLFPWSPGRISVEQTSTLKMMEDPMPQQVNVAQKKLHLMESPCWSRLLAGNETQSRERSTHCCRFSGRRCDPTGNWSWYSRPLKDWSPWKGSMLEQLRKSLPWEGLLTGTGEQCDEKGAAKMKCYELTKNFIP